MSTNLALQDDFALSFQAIAAQRGFGTAQSYMDFIAHDPQELVNLAAAFAERENIDLMATLSSKVTGIDNLLIFTPLPGGQHGPRIKVAIDPAHRATGVQATVPFDAPAIGLGSPKLEIQVRAFIDLNRAALMDYWDRGDGEVSTDEFISRLRPIP